MSIKTCMFGILALVISIQANSAIINGDFSDGLTGWAALDDVTESSGSARIGDDSVFGLSTLYQVSDAELGASVFGFDFYGDFADFDPVIDFPDIFSVSLYLSNDSSLDFFVFEAVEWLFEADVNGSTAYLGNVSSSSLGAGWQRFEFEFENLYSYVMPVFDLYGNVGGVDSHVLIDNVSLSSLPVVEVSEPRTLVLMLMGLLVVFTMRARRIA